MYLLDALSERTMAYNIIPGERILSLSDGHEYVATQKTAYVFERTYAPTYAEVKSAEPITEPNIPKVFHVCQTKTPRRQQKFYQGVLDFQREKGVPVETFEEVCADPKCVLARIRS